MNNINVNDFSSYKFERKYKIVTFRSAVNFKRFTLKFTKFKRKAIARFKHRTNWIIYTNIIRLWVNDFLFNKHNTRFQFYNRILLNSLFVYNFNFITIRYDQFFNNFNFFLAIRSKKSYLYYNRNSGPFLYKHNNLSYAFLYEEPSLNNSVVPVFHEWDNIHYLYNSQNSSKINFSWNDISEICTSLFISKAVELKKIFILLYIHILKF